MVGRLAYRGVYRELLTSGEFLIFFAGAVLIPLGLILNALGWSAWHWKMLDLPGVFFLASMALNGVPVLSGVAQGLKRREWNVDELVAIALLACLFAGEWFEGATVAAIMKLGSLIEEFVSNRARNAIRSLVSLNPSAVILKTENGEERVVERSRIRPGDLVVHRPGDVLAVDGVIVQGRAGIDESSLTGESVPVNRCEGQEVCSGSVNLDGLLLIRATRCGDDSTLSRIITLVQAAEESKVKGARLVDRYAGWFTPVILSLSALTWFLTGDFQRAITVLIVGCPCSFLLSGPVPTAAAIGRAARLGVMFKDGAALENLALADEWFFDKTGTLTSGAPRVAAMEPCGRFREGDVGSLLAFSAAVETGSEHPLGRAVVREAKARGLVIPAASDIVVIPGAGISGMVQGRRVEMIAWNDDTGSADSPVMLKVDGQDSLVLRFHDPERPEARSLVHLLRAQGAQQVGMLSGDHVSVARAMGSRLGLDVALGRQSPASKQEFLQARRDAVSVFVGDGLNDAPALASARIGIAMGSRGVDAALDSADVVLMKDQIHLLPFLQRLGRRMRRIVHTNILLSFTLNMVSVGLAFFGILNPVLGAVTHNVGSVLVVSISATLGLMNPRKQEFFHESQ